MIFNIRHKTTYIYSKKVFLEPHIFRLHPKNNCNQRVHNFNISINPEEDGKSVFLDTAENDSITAWFSGLHDQLEIVTESVVETLRKDPFDYILSSDEYSTLPFEYPEPDIKLLKIYIDRNQSNKVMEIKKELLDLTGNNTQSFLIHLSNHIYSNFTQIVREKGDPWDSDTTIRNASGSCRDLTALFVDVCRAVGLAARFVSGYAYGSDKNIEDQLHAWAEVYIPGGGWRGFDPSLGLATSDQHISLVSGPSHEMTSPVEGVFRGTDATSVLTFEINISSQ